MVQHRLPMTPLLADFIEKNQLQKGFADIAQEWFIPLADALSAHHKSAKRPFFVGVNGCQGSGKSTLTHFLCEYLREERQHQVINLSLDDFYLSRAARATLAEQVHPLLKTRGVPGTHDTTMIRTVLDQLATNSGDVRLCRFDKSTDDPVPPDAVPAIAAPFDIIIFEGWCWGVEAQALSALTNPVNSLERDEDPDMVWRTFVNQQLSEYYQPLYERMDFWVMLQAPGFDVVYQWRREQEHKLIASLAEQQNDKATTGVMTDQEIARFIAHYQRLTEHGLATLPDKCDRVFQLDQHRVITGVRGSNL